MGVLGGIFRNTALAVYVGDGVVAAPAIAFSNDFNTGLYRIGADSIGITLGGALDFTFGAPNKIGSATSGHALTAASDLLVAGKLEVDGVAYFDTDIIQYEAGTTNERLKFAQGDPSQILFNSGNAGLIQNVGGLTFNIDTGGVNTYDYLFQNMGVTRLKIDRTGDIVMYNALAQGQARNDKGAMNLKTLDLANTSDIANFIPAGSLVLGITVRVTTAVTTSGATNTFSVGTAADTDAWGLNIAGALNTTTTIANFTVVNPAFYASATALRFSAPGAETFATGIIRATIHYIDLTAATS